ncbi:MAG: hypothetical protein ACAH89_09015 [Rariglobus sp.]|nr:hypothetical protein [Rariglobus sp.]
MRFATPATLSIAFISLLLSSTAAARVGEPREEFERRLLEPYVGTIIPKEKNPDPAIEAELMRQQPFNEVRDHFPEGVRERKYWKSAVPRMLSKENGWKVHVFYQDNLSVLEAYQRVGSELNEFEIRNILAANQGKSEWKRIEADSLESRASAIGCDYELTDGSLRARISGNWIMVYSIKLDAYVKEQLRIIKERQVTQQEEKTRIQQTEAPGSTSGF